MKRCRERRRKNLFWADAALKKEGYTKIAKSLQQACKLLFSWGWMVVDKLARLIASRKKIIHCKRNNLVTQSLQLLIKLHLDGHFEFHQKNIFWTSAAILNIGRLAE